VAKQIESLSKAAASKNYYRGGFEAEMNRREAGLILGIRYILLVLVLRAILVFGVLLRAGDVPGAVVGNHGGMARMHKAAAAERKVSVSRHVPHVAARQVGKLS
jgi:hypothetical protein